MLGRTSRSRFLLRASRTRRIVHLASPITAGVVMVTASLVACGEQQDVPRVAVATNLTVPRGTLERATRLELAVFEGDVSCRAETGEVALPNGASGATELARRELDNRGCQNGALFCGDITIPQSDVPRVFAATAYAGSTTLALGCVEAKVEQAAVPVAIAMVRYVEPSNCNDGRIQPTEQCDPNTGPLCDADCQTKEILISDGDPRNGTDTGGVGDKSEPAFLWPAQSGNQGRFVAFFTDRKTGVTGNLDIGMRVLGTNLEPITTPDMLARGSIFLPNGPVSPPPVSAGSQSAPQAAFVGGVYYVVFQDDSGGNGLDIRLRSMDGTFAAQQPEGGALIINGSGTGEPDSQRNAAIAGGPQGRLFVAWEDVAAGKIVGRMLAPPSSLGSQNDISGINGNSSVSLAPTRSGWVAVWRSGTGVKLRTINADGTPQGSEEVVNETSAVPDHPRVAALEDGRFAVTFAAGGDIYVQRYDERGAKIAGDQAAPINDRVTDGAQESPVIAATTAAGGSYVVAWLDPDTGHVRARMLGGTAGFLYNHVDGRSSEFQASRANGRARANPTIASGGSPQYVAIGWEEKNLPGAGIVVRRFPLPEE